MLELVAGRLAVDLTSHLFVALAQLKRAVRMMEAFLASHRKLRCHWTLAGMRLRTICTGNFKIGCEAECT